MSYQENALDQLRSFEKLGNDYKINDAVMGLELPITQQTKNNISYEIEIIYKTIDSVSYIEALSLFMDIYGYEYSDINKLISTTILNKITSESLSNGSLKASMYELKCHDITDWVK